jgi:hypothetical protein
MPDWNGHLAFEDAAGRCPARFDIDAGSYVRCRVYGEKFKSPFNDSWFTNLKFDKATGASLSGKYDGRIVNVSEDMMAGLDPNTGREPMITLRQHRALLAEALARAGQAPAGRQRLVIDIEAGGAEIVSVEMVV